MPLGFPPLRIGLAASPRPRSAPDGALLRLLAPLERTIREQLRAELFVLARLTMRSARRSCSPVIRA